MVEELYKLVTEFCRRWGIYDEDVVQDLVGIIYQRLDKYDKRKGKFSTFVFMNCRNYYLMRKEKHERTTPIYNDELVHSVADESHDWYIAYIYNNICSPMLRDYLQGYKQKDIAKKYNLNYITCNQRILKELRELKEAYGE